jgi:hypothetical protein
MFKNTADVCRLLRIYVEVLNNGAIESGTRMRAIAWALLRINDLYNVEKFPPESNVKILGVPHLTFQGIVSNLWNCLMMSQLIHRPLFPRSILSSQPCEYTFSTATQLSPSQTGT